MLLCKEEHAKAIDRAVFPGLQGGPHNHTTAAIAVALKEASQPSFRAYAQAVVDNARALAEALLERGFNLVTGGTDNHLFLLGLIDKEITGKDADAALGSAHITVNKNSVPNDPRSPFVTSGLRIGTPASTTRGFGVEEMTSVAHWICDILDHMDDQDQLDKVREQVIELCGRFPVYRSD